MKVYLVLPAAGLGTRMKVVNPELPKELLPLGGVPVIHYSFEEALKAGIKDIVLIIGPHKEILRRYIEDRKVRKSLAKDHERASSVVEALNFHFLYQSQPAGEADAIALAEPLTGGSPVAIVYPDNVHIPPGQALKRLLDVYMKYGCDVLGLTRVPEPLQKGTGNAGRVKLKPFNEGLYKIIDLLPKGQGHFVPRFPGELRTCGVALTGPHIYQYIKRARQHHSSGEFIDVPVKKLLAKERTLLGALLPGLVYDVGNPTGYHLCNQRLPHQRWQS